MDETDLPDTISCSAQVTPQGVLLLPYRDDQKGALMDAMSALRQDSPPAVWWEVVSGYPTVYVTGPALALTLAAPAGAEELMAEHGTIVLPTRAPSPDDPRLKVVVLDALRPWSAVHGASLN